MQAAYQSDEFNDASSCDATSSNTAGEEEESEEEETRGRIANADVDKQLESEVEKPWWENLGPRTRRQARVNYTEEKIIPAQSPSRVSCNRLRYCSVFQHICLIISKVSRM
jgi:hypothetical protein